AWVPAAWAEPARAALEGMAERHPSRTILLFAEPDAQDNRIDAEARVERWEVPDTDRGLVTEVVELTLRGARSMAPASIVEPLLISDLPVFLRWRGEPPWGHATAAQAWLLWGWLRSRLGRNELALEHEPAETLEGVALDGEAVPLPPGDPPAPSDVLSDELERFTPDPVYEAAVLATTP